MYDKDDFPRDRFDNAAFKADADKKHRFNTAWSNESFELWLLWHFQDYTANNHRTEYIKALEKYVSDYNKGDKEVYETIFETGDFKAAIKRGEKQAKYYKDMGEVTPSKMYAHSTVYKLIKGLMKYL